MKLLLFVLPLFAVTVFAQELKFSKFEKKADGYYIEDNDGGKFIISTERFKSQSAAVGFCEKKSLKMSTDVDAIALAIVGSEKHKPVEQAFSFATKGASGLVIWNHNPKEAELEGTKFVADMILFLDGRGMDAEPGNFAAHGGLFKAPAKSGLPAICGRFPEIEGEQEEGRVPSNKAHAWTRAKKFVKNRK